MSRKLILKINVNIKPTTLLYKKWIYKIQVHPKYYIKKIKFIFENSFLNKVIILKPKEEYIHPNVDLFDSTYCFNNLVLKGMNQKGQIETIKSLLATYYLDNHYFLPEPIFKDPEYGHLLLCRPVNNVDIFENNGDNISKSIEPPLDDFSKKFLVYSEGYGEGYGIYPISMQKPNYKQFPKAE